MVRYGLDMDKSEVKQEGIHLPDPEAYGLLTRYRQHQMDPEERQAFEARLIESGGLDQLFSTEFSGAYRYALTEGEACMPDFEFAVKEWLGNPAKEADLILALLAARILDPSEEFCRNCLQLLGRKMLRFPGRQL